MKEIWNWLDGKKTIIAATYWAIVSNIVPIWFANGVLPHPWDKINLTIGTLLTVAGIGHKVSKNFIADREA